MTLEREDIKRLKKIGHELKPIVTIGSNGLSENVILELNRALNDHELIKIKIAHEDRDALIETLSEQVDLNIVQTIGNIALVYRAAAKPNPKLSNIMRFS